MSHFPVRTTRRGASLLLAVLALLTIAVVPVHAEGVLEVHPERPHCVVPLEVIGSGFGADRAVSLNIVLDGVVKGTVDGPTTSSDGGFRLPVPFALIDNCSRDANGIVELLLDGSPTGVMTPFEVLGPLPTPVPATPAPPATGNGRASGSGSSFEFALLVSVIALAAAATPLAGRRYFRL